jgi:hypothetical protein
VTRAWRWLREKLTRDDLLQPGGGWVRRVEPPKPGSRPRGLRPYEAPVFPQDRPRDGVVGLARLIRLEIGHGGANFPGAAELYRAAGLIEEWDAIWQEAHAAPHLTPEVRHGAEQAINDSFGLPPVWVCRCGGRPFEGKPCPRCGRPREQSEVTR